MSGISRLNIKNQPPNRFLSLSPFPFFFFFLSRTIDSTNNDPFSLPLDIIVAVAVKARGSFARIRACIARVTREATAFFCLGERIRVNNARAFNERASRVATNAYTRGQRKRERDDRKKNPAACVRVFLFFTFFFYFFTFFDARFLQARSNSESERKSLSFEIICSLDE